MNLARWWVWGEDEDKKRIRCQRCRRNSGCIVEMLKAFGHFLFVFARDHALPSPYAPQILVRQKLSRCAISHSDFQAIRCKYFSSTEFVRSACIPMPVTIKTERQPHE